MSQYPGHLTELARQAGERSAELVVAVGGDGTVNEVVNGLLRAPGQRPELAVLAHGTGMDFIRTHGIPTAPEAAIAVARDGRTRTIDAGRAVYTDAQGGRQERFFANVASAGLSGAVARRANQGSKALGGKISFFWALVNAFARWRNADLIVEVQGARREGRMTDVVVANGQYHGGAMWLCPEASPDDGLFDVLIVGDVTKADFIRSVAKIYRGTHLTHPKIELLRSPTVSVNAREPMPVELDGEQPGTTPVLFDVVPAALRVRVPR